MELISTVHPNGEVKLKNRNHEINNETDNRDYFDFNLFIFKCIVSNKLYRTYKSIKNIHDIEYNLLKDKFAL